MSPGARRSGTTRPPKGAAAARTARSARAATLVLVDDATAATFEPFASTRPWSTMRVGARLVHERWTFAFGPRAVRHLAPAALRDFREDGAPLPARGVLAAGTIIADARCAPALVAQAAARDPHVHAWRCDGRLAAFVLPRDVPLAELAAARDAGADLAALAKLAFGRAVRGGATLPGTWCDAVWDVIGALPSLLKHDLPAIARADRLQPIAEGTDGITVIGDGGAWRADDARIEPHVVLDTRKGAVVIEAGADVQAFTRLVGPVIVGAGSTVLGGRIAASAIGPVCKLQGELADCVLLGYANKGHDGFVGHSVFGRWVNLGAGTTTSNLKNTYGSVSLWTPFGVRDSGLQFLGTLFGDHVKTGIGLRLTTGCVLGAGSNVFDTMPPKVVAPFAWGGGAPYAVYDAERFAVATERAMARRHVAFDARARRFWRAVHASRWSDDGAR